MAPKKGSTSELGGEPVGELHESLGGYQSEFGSQLSSLVDHFSPCFEVDIANVFSTARTVDHMSLRHLFW
jgi:hypothetical protein